jgi:8-oxo-dGTP diphosphatase
LTGIITETGYEGAAHWLMFLFELTPRLKTIPPAHREGTFEFHSCEALNQLAMPETDREMIWPLFWQHRGGFFAAHCVTSAGQPNQWTLEQSNVRL